MKTFLTALALAAAVAAVPVAAQVTYMTGQNDPWGTTSNDKAMDVVFGAGAWTKIQGFTAEVFAKSSFIFMDGGDSNATEFGDFLTKSADQFTDFLRRGGHVLTQVAPNQDTYASYDLPGKLTIDGIHGYSYPTASSEAKLTESGLAGGLDGGGAGTYWTGGYFAHANVTGGDCLVEGNAGCVLASSIIGKGRLLGGGETPSDFHSEGGFQLRVNEIKLAAAGVGAVPEPVSWALFVAGFGLIGGAMRRRETMVLA